MASSIVSYGGAATSTFLPTPTPFFPFGSNFVRDRINTCAPYQVERIKRKLDREDVDGDKGLEESRRGALFCRSGTWLEMIPTAYDDSIHVHGTHDENSKFSIVEFISVAMSLVSIRGVETKHFICMDPTGKLYATPSSNYSNECVFIEEMMENYYNLYSSCAYSTEDNPWYIELRRSGKPRKGPSTRKRRKASHFLVVHHDFNRLHHPTHPNGNLVGNPLGFQDVSDLVVASLYHKPPSHPLFRPSAAKSTPAPAARISRLRAKVQTTVDEDDKKQREIDEKKRRREKKKRRREERLQREEQRRRDRKLELSILRAQELRRSRYNKPKQASNVNSYNSRYPSSSSTSSNRQSSSSSSSNSNSPYNNSGNGNGFNRQNGQSQPSRYAPPPSPMLTTTVSPYHRSYHHHHHHLSNSQREQNRMIRSEYQNQQDSKNRDVSRSYSSISPQNPNQNQNQNPNPFPYTSNYQRKS